MKKRSRKPKRTDDEDKKIDDMPKLTIAEVSRVCLNSHGELFERQEWAVVSDEEEEPLTQHQAIKVLAVYAYLQEELGQEAFRTMLREMGPL